LHLSLKAGASRAVLAFTVALAAGIFAPEFVVAQSSNEAQLVVRVQELEATVRDLTGQVQGLQFTLTQMQQQLQKMQDDNEFRFQQLEGGAGKKSEAVTHSGGATPPGASPQATTEAKPIEAKPAATAGADATPAPAPLVDENKPGTVPPASVGDGLGDSQDPLVGKGGAESTTLGTIPAGQDGKPLNLNLDSSQPISNGDAIAQYKAGYDAITRGDYPFAADQFRQFIALYPKDPQAPDATNWLGEALLQQQSYDDAADVLLTGFQTYQNSPRAPDLLLKLGIALAGAGQQDTACRTFFEVAKRYPKQPSAFQQRLQTEKSKAKCPV
jgi:tol-pal system protein YbgF